MLSIHPREFHPLRGIAQAHHKELQKLAEKNKISAARFIANSPEIMQNSAKCEKVVLQINSKPRQIRSP